VNKTCNFDNLDLNSALNYAKKFAGEKYSIGLETVLSVGISDISLLPRLRFDENNKIILEEYIQKWVHAYLTGYENRPTKRQGKKSNTYPDTIIKIILQSRLPNIDEQLANQIECGHSILMTIENLVGDLLEEYLSSRLSEFGWFCCWGSTIDAVDFCKADGSLLQVKNSDNSENSSSSRVRNGTNIKKWSRRVSTKQGYYDWDILNEHIGSTTLNEVDFKFFVTKAIESNPSCIYVSDNNILQGESI
jgi:hypothetical protein